MSSPFLNLFQVYLKALGGKKRDRWKGNLIRFNVKIFQKSQKITFYTKLIFKVIGTLSEDKDGWKKQLTCTSWGKYNPKFDLRAWDSEYTSMKKGITLSLEELIALRDLLNESDLETILAEAIEEKQASKEQFLDLYALSCYNL